MFSGSTQNLATVAIYFGGFILIFYFLLIRPRKQQEKKHETLVSGIKKGDKLVTIGGIKGEVTKVKDDSVILRVCENVEIEFLKKAIAYDAQDPQ